MQLRLKDRYYLFIRNYNSKAIHLLVLSLYLAIGVVFSFSACPISSLNIESFSAPPQRYADGTLVRDPSSNQVLMEILITLFFIIPFYCWAHLFLYRVFLHVIFRKRALEAKYRKLIFWNENQIPRKLDLASDADNKFMMVERLYFGGFLISYAIAVYVMSQAKVRDSCYLDQTFSGVFLFPILPLPLILFGGVVFAPLISRVTSNKFFSLNSAEMEFCDIYSILLRKGQFSDLSLRLEPAYTHARNCAIEMKTRIAEAKIRAENAYKNSYTYIRERHYAKLGYSNTRDLAEMSLKKEKFLFQYDVNQTLSKFGGVEHHISSVCLVDGMNVVQAGDARPSLSRLGDLYRRLNARFQVVIFFFDANIYFKASEWHDDRSFEDHSIKYLSDRTGVPVDCLYLAPSRVRADDFIITCGRMVLDRASSKVDVSIISNDQYRDERNSNPQYTEFLTRSGVLVEVSANRDKILPLFVCCNQVEMSLGLQSRNVTKGRNGSKA